MLTNYLKIALRTMLRYKSFSIINIVGLTLGLTAFLGITLYVVDEFSYDQFHANKDRIYRGVSTFDRNGQSQKSGATPNRLATTAVKEIPEVENAARYFHHNFGDIAFVTSGENKFSEDALFYADSELFDILTIPFIRTSEVKPLNKPNTVVISESAALKYFGPADPIGKILTVDNSLSFEVTGIFKDIPRNSFVAPALIASFSSNWFGQERAQSWRNASFDTFFLIHEGVSQAVVEEKIMAMVKRNQQEGQTIPPISLQKLTDIRLHSDDFTGDGKVYGDYKQVKIMIALACVILLIASVNYMNLSTAQSQRRNKEVGINKALGASRFVLTRRFYAEASLFVLISLFMSLIAVSVLLPLFNSLSGKVITLDFLFTGWFWLGFIGLWVALSILSGLYPALYLSSFSPKMTLQKTSVSGSQAFIRKGLVVFQFSVSIVLIICSVVFYKQMNFIRDKKLGYEPEQVMAIMTAPAQNRDQIIGIQTAYKALTNVVEVGRSQFYPGSRASGRSIYKPGDEAGTPIQTVRTSREVLDILNVHLIAGQRLPEFKDKSDTTIQVIVNKKTLEYLDLTPDQAIGQRVNIMGFEGMTEIVGVMDNFHYNSLHQEIMPLCFHNFPEPYNYLLVKVNAADLSGTISQLEDIYKKNIPASFEYVFLDQHLSSLYLSEQKLSNVVMCFSGLAIFVACLGLYALAAFTTEQRTKEIGIRKVLGASVPNVIGLLSRDFMILVLIAFVVGIPAGYYMMNKWLQGFAYKTEITLLVFVAAGFISTLIAGITVSFESLRAARTNPVKSLRSE